MKDTFKFDEYDVELATKYSEKYAGKRFNNELEVVIGVAFSDLRNLPTLRYKEGVKIVFREYVEKWVKAYFMGYDNRPSVRRGNKSSTFSDPIVKSILGARILNLADLDRLEAAHSTMMTIENIVGDLLEEYLCQKLHTDGWYCAWGSCIDAVDFCKEGGSLLQVKNSDNSENSSSTRVRNGTTIKKWHRRNSTKRKSFNWDELNKITGREDLSELAFQAFTKSVIESNPASIYVDENNPLITISIDEANMIF